MNIKNQTVIHNTYGVGTVINHDGDYITVSFDIGDKKFPYPDVFEKFLRIKDDLLFAEIQLEIENKKKQKALLQNENNRLRAIETNNVINSRKTIKKKIARTNIAFKCNYCDGGKSKNSIGFNGLCSDEIIKYNIIKAKHIWCSSDSPCKKYINGDISSYKNLVQFINNENDGFACYESIMLRDWKASAGITQTGINKGRPMKLMGVQNNSLAILTSRYPNDVEQNRFIFAVFLVDETYEGDAREEGYVTTTSKYKIQMIPSELHKLKFWNYYKNINAPDVIKFGSGLHRYIPDDQAVQILRDISFIKRGTEKEALSIEFTEYFCQVNNIDLNNVPQKSGALIK